MEPFAALSDYRERWGGDEPDSRVEAHLSDASYFLADELDRYGKAVDPLDDRQAERLRRICCRIAHDTLGAAESIGGVKQASMTAGPYSQMLTMSEPTGKMFLYRDEKRSLGIGGSKVGSVFPRGRRRDD